MDQQTDKERRRAARKQAIDWLLQMDDGKADAGLRMAFERWLAADPLHQTAYREVEQLFAISGKALAASPDETRRTLRKKGGSQAGIVVALLFIAASGFWMADGPMRLAADVMTGTERDRIVTLPDGSRVHLNANSAIAETFSGDERRIALLRGEAYFEVEPDAARPFIVDAGAGQVRVLGTAFNVNLTSADTEVAVTHNRVEVSAVRGSGKVALNPGERVSVDEGGSLHAVESVRKGDETPWLSGRLVFEDRPLALVAEELGRYLPEGLLVIGDGVRNRRITGSFDISDPEAALKGFAAAFDLRTRSVGRLVTVLY